MPRYRITDRISDFPLSMPPRSDDIAPARSKRTENARFSRAFVHRTALRGVIRTASRRGHRVPRMHDSAWRWQPGDRSKVRAASRRGCGAPKMYDSSRLDLGLHAATGGTGHVGRVFVGHYRRCAAGSVPSPGSAAGVGKVLRRLRRSCGIPVSWMPRSRSPSLSRSVCWRHLHAAGLWRRL